MDLTTWHRARHLIAELDALADRERAAGIVDESPEYLDLNSRVNDALAVLPWWQRPRFPMILANTLDRS
ncbi:hypothetical protein [Salinispora oceanensis]|uniref:hypothetical protein n=1 Tax=Salinispora oceanensis TaxID=1050199 RepID=UPI00039CCF82|nr:hypothetical protein [Salinispora oceanensis]